MGFGRMFGPRSGFDFGRLAVTLCVMTAACAGAPQPPQLTYALSGQEVPLEAFRGRVVLLNVWATWCRPCLMEVPELARLADQFGDRVTFVALHYQSESVAGVQVTNWLRLQPEYFAHDVVWGNSAMRALFPQRVLPTTYVIGRGGGVVRVFEGAILSESRLAELRDAIAIGLRQAVTPADVR